MVQSSKNPFSKTTKSNRSNSIKPQITYQIVFPKSLLHGLLEELRWFITAKANIAVQFKNRNAKQSQDEMVQTLTLIRILHSLTEFSSGDEVMCCIEIGGEFSPILRSITQSLGGNSIAVCQFLVCYETQFLQQDKQSAIVSIVK